MADLSVDPVREETHGGLFTADLFFGCGCLDSLPEDLKAIVLPQTASQTLSGENFHFLKVTSLVVLSGVSRKTFCWLLRLR